MSNADTTSGACSTTPPLTVSDLVAARETFLEEQRRLFYEDIIGKTPIVKMDLLQGSVWAAGFAWTWSIA